MRRLTVLVLLMVLALSASAVAQDPDGDPSRDEATYQGLWCLYLDAHPYMVEVPDDVTCDYEPRPMTVEEAGPYYLRAALDSNYVGDQWSCAARKAGNKWTWKQDKRWGQRYLRTSKVFRRRLEAVMWPEDIQLKVAKLIDLDIASDYAMRRAYNQKTYAASVRSGRWNDYIKASKKTSPVADQIRAGLRLPHVPDAPNACKAVKRHEERLAADPTFDDPFEHPDLKRIAALLAQAGLVESHPNAEGVASLFLTEAGFAAARAMSAIADDATAQEVVTGLFTPMAGEVPEPSPDPELIELVPPEPVESPTVAG